MRTLALRSGERVAVDAEEWRDAFGVVSGGRVQLEQRDGEPGPVLGRGAGFWLRGTGVRALHNPGCCRATVRIVTPADVHRPINPTLETGTETRRNDMSTTHRFRRLTVTGVVATIAAMAATALVAACAQAMGADFKVTDGDETVPVSGIAFVTGVFSVVGVGIAAAFLRWSDHPAVRLVQTTVALTAISLVPPFLAPADAGTTGSLVVIHLVAAAVMIPSLARSLRARTE